MNRPVTVDADAVVIGAGPAGACAAILLATAGWRVVLVEQQAYPRQKVCGECIGAGNLALIDRLGVGPEFRRLAGTELRQVGWMSADATIRADLPSCSEDSYPYGRALGRDRFDPLLLERARSLGVRILQPAKVRAVSGRAGKFNCEIVEFATHANRAGSPYESPARTLTASLIIDAHGSWELGPTFGMDGTPVRPPQRASDLFAFKATFHKSNLEPGFLPVLALDGGYGGMVVANHGRTTLACCLRRDALHLLRARNRGVQAGVVVEASLRQSCRGVRDALGNATRDGAWQSVGPLRPGVRLKSVAGVYRVGNAAGEAHPLIGEGITMALQSSALLVDILTHTPCAKIDELSATRRQEAYASAWRTAFVPRLRLAALYAHVAMRPALAQPARGILRRWPMLLTAAAGWAGKARKSVEHPSIIEETL
jgi:2-polyprenyl-6-methoxyphenol hydroxylase-like FAD-dependent oxidoreductase